MNKVLKALLYYLGIPALASFLGSLTMLFTNNEWVCFGVTVAVAAAVYLAHFKKIDAEWSLKVHGVILGVMSIVFTVLMIIGKGGMKSVAVSNFGWIIPGFLTEIIIFSLTGAQELIFLSAFAVYLIGFAVSWIRAGKKAKLVWVAVPLAVLVVATAVSSVLYMNRDEKKYGGHGFAYMNGYSSTDLTDYTVYAENSKLVTLDHNATVIENQDDMPVMDGAEACYPVYAALAKAAYKDISQIEAEFKRSDANGMRMYNGKIVRFTNTIRAYMSLTYPYDESNQVDLFFGARPSREQILEAQQHGVELEVTPIGREGFVFFVEDDNPVTNLTADEVRKIYSGEITNWKELGGKDREIVAFQRPAGSGSQSMMEYFMGNVKLKAPKTFEYVSTMEGIITQVAEYANEAGAMGYTFRYFLEGLQQEKNVRMLSIDGVYPSVENIKNGSYPLTVDLVLVTRKDDPNLNVRKMIEFVLSEDGQNIVEKTGYAPVRVE